MVVALPAKIVFLLGDRGGFAEREHRATAKGGDLPIGGGRKSRTVGLGLATKVAVYPSTTGLLIQ
jgi:hypothetical protein